MIESKEVVILSDEIINIGKMDDMPDGAILETREMSFTEDYGWREAQWKPPISEIDKLKMAQAEQFETILTLLGGI